VKYSQNSRQAFGPIRKTMSDSQDKNSAVESISNSLEQLVIIESLKILYPQEVLTSLLEKRKNLVSARTEAIMKKMGDKEIIQATNELEDFDHDSPLIKKFARLAS